MLSPTLHFLDGSVDLEQSMKGNYESLLVTLSVVTAILASYAALQISRIVRRKELSIYSKWRWLAAGALTMGIGIWSMHFIGMLAFSLPVPIQYDPRLTMISVVPGILASAVVMHVLATHEGRLWRINISGFIQAVGIGAMHYTGMAAMIADVEMRYHGGIFAFSLLLAHLLATGSLYVQHRVLDHSHVSKSNQPETLLAALIMGLAISGMHYTGMAAAYYLPYEGTTRLHQDLISLEALVGLILLGTGSILIVTLVVVFTKQNTAKIQDRYRAIFESTGDAIILLDEFGSIQAFNPAAAEIFGFHPNVVIGQDIKLLMPELSTSLQDEFLQHNLADVDGGTMSKRREIEIQRGDGTQFYAELKVRALHEPDGKRFFTSIIRDLTEEHALQIKLLSAQKMESIGQLAAGVAHELNTPAQYVGDNLKFLNESFAEIEILIEKFSQLQNAAESGQITPDLLCEIKERIEYADIDFLRKEIPEALTQSLEGIDRMSQIVRSMKEFSHPGGTEKKPADINRMVESAINISRNEWKYIADIEVDLDKDLPLVPCFVGELNQVLLNLLLNAAQAVAEVYTEGQDHKGKITIRTDYESRHWCLIEVSDSGCGMSEEVCSRVFDPFFTTKEVGKGSGQGLAIAYSVVVEQHAGSIEVDSQVNQGTSFTVRIPIAESSLYDADLVSA